MKRLEHYKIDFTDSRNYAVSSLVISSYATHLHMSSKLPHLPALLWSLVLFGVTSEEWGGLEREGTKEEVDEEAEAEHCKWSA